MMKLSEFAKKKTQINEKKIYQINQSKIQKPYQNSKSIVSIGMSTLLNFQNDEQFFQNITMSRISNNLNPKSKYFQTESNPNLKQTIIRSQVQEMKRKRQKLQKKIKNKYKQHQPYYKQKKQKSEISSSYTQTIKISNQHQLSKHKSRINKNVQSKQDEIKSEQDEIKSHSYDTNKSSSQYMSYNQSEQLTFQQHKQQNYLRKLNFIKNVQRTSIKVSNIPFQNFLNRQILLLKFQSFIRHFQSFNNKWLIRNLRTYTQFIVIVSKRNKEQVKQKFIEWKRITKQSSKKQYMVQMIKRRVQAKRQQRKLIPISTQINNNKEDDNTIIKNDSNVQWMKENRSNQNVSVHTSNNSQIQNVSINIQAISPIKKDWNILQDSYDEKSSLLVDSFIRKQKPIKVQINFKQKLQQQLNDINKDNRQ